ncbi:outer membrane beta-barrel protein [Chondrinema litorale]|uniref:outer membrane beta-barrel protein n=1 Tax=Chondrinema litorale TaxID=2994555 RepID=UPI0025435E30|nr:outer membrane beta-barrel protein [Chondrinema litorale]UZR96968.1 outer membrane beta-barrel protein [Chondrinema litorale]
MKKLILISVLKLAFFTTIFAQQNFQLGYVIQNSGDTLKGAIDNKLWRRNPETVTFKNSSGTTQTFGVNNIKAFQVDGSIYKSATVKVETSSVDMQTLEDNNELEFDKRSVLLEAIFIGAKSLYMYKGEWERDHFFIEVDGQFETLIFKKYYRYYNGEKRLSYNRQYKKQLIEYLGDCNSIAKSIDFNNNFEAYVLKSVFKKYYKCIDSEPDYQKQKKSLNFTFGLTAGLTLNQLSFKGSSRPYRELVAAEISTQTTPTFGISMDMQLEGNRNRWSIFNELYYTSYSVEIDEMESLSQIGISYIKIGNSLRYRLVNSQEASLFIELGITNGFSVSAEDFSSTIFENYRKYEQGILGSIGFQVNKVSFLVRYEKSNGISNYELLASPVNRFSAIFGYSF